jgi:hypothetical protein
LRLTLNQRPRPGDSALRTWLRRIGIAGFLFFLLKGLAWLVIAGFVLVKGVLS